MNNIWIKSRIKDPEIEKNLLDVKVNEEMGQLKREKGEHSCPVGLCGLYTGNSRGCRSHSL